MLERLADTNQLVAFAIATFVVPALFLAIVAIAAYRRSRGAPPGRRLAGLVAFSGGLSLGTLLLFGSEPVLAAPIAIAAGLVVAGRWRARRRTQAGLVAAGVGVPILVAWSTVSPGADPANHPEVVAYWVAGGAILVALGVIIVARGDPPTPVPSAAAPPGQPGSRAIGSIAAAIREPTLIGPFGQPEIAMLVALVATLLVAPLALPADSSLIVRIGAPSILAAIIATEAYVRAWPAQSRRAFEAFSWLGEFELARFRRVFGGRPPSSVDGAQRWLRAHPPGPDADEAAGGRVEVLLFAGRIDEARAAVDAMPRETPTDRFEHAALVDLVEWRAGAVDPEASANLEAMVRAARAIEPADSDARLLAEVSVATARVRRRMADGRAAAGDAAEPLLEVRTRLGHRADGQVGRVLRRRLIPVLLVVSLGFGLISVLLGSLV